jgi:nitrite reductase (NADH) small subunit
LERYHVARTEDFEELEPILVQTRSISVAVYKFKQDYRAYLNRCPHQGGPACEGATLPDIDCKIENGKIHEFNSAERYTIVCPWHGIEYLLSNGKCVVDDKLQLTSFNVIVENGEVFIER